MSYNQKKFLDYNGLVHLLEKFDDYPTNDILSTVINSIDSAISAKVSDVQINGTSIVSNNIANIPIASSDYGVVKINPDYGIGIFNGALLINQASADNIKSGNNSTKAVSAMRQHEAVFYGLSKVAGVDLKNETVTLGTYPTESKTAILTMLGAAASSDIPDISGKANTADLAVVATSGSYNDLSNKPFIPSAISDLTDDSGHYTKPVNGIPATDMTSGVQTSLGLADTAYQKPNNGIPASDLASGVIPSVPVQDVQIKNTSILNNGVANIPLAANGAVGLVQGNNTYGTAITAAGDIMIYRADDSAIKNGNGEYKPIVPYTEHQAVFYGLAKAAGDTTQRESQNNVGVYTSSAQSAIQAMLDVPSTSSVASSIASAVGNVHSFDVEVVQSLPTQSIKEHTIYFVPKTGDTNDVYDEYIYVNNAWEMIGNTQIDLSNYVQKTDYASANTAGIVYIDSNRTGLAMWNDPVTGHPLLTFNSANTSDIKDGVTPLKPLTPARQHESLFYGLARAAGDTTQSQSDNAIGTYTTEAKEAIQTMLDVPAKSDVPTKLSDLVDDIGASDTFIEQDPTVPNWAKQTTKPTYTANEVGAPTVAEMNLALDNKVDKDAIDNAGITARSYSLKFGGEFTVTTATTSGYLNPYARASVTGRINKENLHRVTVNGTEYILPTRLWYENGNSGLKVYEYLGNLGLYIGSTSGVPGGTDNVPFVIISDLNNSNSIDVLTQTAGTYTIKVEQINNTQKRLPTALIYGDSYAPIEKNNNGGTYNGFSIGVNELINKRAVLAFGYGNKIENEFTVAIGDTNNLSGSWNYALGYGNNTNGTSTFVIGSNNEVENGIVIGKYNDCTSGISIGSSNVSDGLGSVSCGYGLKAKTATDVYGRYNVEISENSYDEWQPNTQYYVGDVVMAALPGSSLPCECISDHISASSFITDYVSRDKWNTRPTWITDTKFLIGIGDSDSERKNGLKISNSGNSYFAGNIFVNCNADSSGGTKLATVDEVVTDVQVNGQSVLSSGVANVPIATYDTFGVIRLSPNDSVSAGTYGLHIENGTLMTVSAAENIIKAGTDTFRPITAKRIDAATFYGLSRAAGVDLKNETVTLGTYPEASKTAIKEMLGVQEGLEVVKLI